MFSSRKANNLINGIREGFIQIVSGDNESNFEKKNSLEKISQISRIQTRKFFERI